MHKFSQKLTFLSKKMLMVSATTSFALCAGIHAGYAAPKEVFSDRYAAIVIDANSGKTLFNANANAQRYPASLTKMMTLYLLFEAMERGQVTPNTPIPVSSYAASRPPTKLGFKPNETIPAEAAAKALITKSANDVAVAIAEYLGGTESNFAQMMTDKAHQLGMMNTHFANASGLPDKNNYSTARDLATLSLALRDQFPEKYKWFKTLSFRFRGKEIRTHNHLVQHMKGVDGIKTGYTQMSGANLASSMRLSGKNIVAVVMGGRSARLRDTHMAELLHRYLPKASKRKTRPLILASANYSFRPAWSMPVPSPKDAPNGASSLLLASNIYNKNSKTVPIPALKKQIDFTSPIITALTDEDSIQKNPAKDAIASILVADNSSLFSSSSQAKEDSLSIKTESDNKDSKTNLKTKKALPSWSIQVGSVPNLKSAEKLLQKAVGYFPKSWKDAKGYVKKATLSGGKKTFYRARFRFNNKAEAQKACALLKKHKFSCYALKEG